MPGDGLGSLRVHPTEYKPMAGWQITTQATQRFHTILENSSDTHTHKTQLHHHRLSHLTQHTPKKKRHILSVFLLSILALPPHHVRRYPISSIIRRSPKRPSSCQRCCTSRLSRSIAPTHGANILQRCTPLISKRFNSGKVSGPVIGYACPPSAIQDSTSSQSVLTWERLTPVSRELFLCGCCLAVA